MTNPLIEGLKLRFAPYALALKLGLVAVVFLTGLGVGCSWQRDRDAQKIGEKNMALVQASIDLKAAGRALREVDANTAAEVARAAANAAANADAAAQAAKRAEDLRERLSDVEADLEEAKRRSPACRAKLEERPCAALR